MVQGCQGNYVIHGYSDRGYIGNVCRGIHGWSRDVRVTTSSMDTLTGGR